MVSLATECMTPLKYSLISIIEPVLWLWARDWGIEMTGGLLNPRSMIWYNAWCKIFAGGMVADE
jgi:hypothetical protein